MMLRRTVTLLMLSILYLASPGVSLANGFADQTLKPRPPSHTPTTKQSIDTTKATQQSPKQYWNLQDADIRAVIAAVSKETGTNFIVDPRVQGKLSIVSSTPIGANEVYQVFLSGLSMLGYAAIPAGRIVKIVPSVTAIQQAAPLADELSPGEGEALVVRVVPVRYVSAIQLVPILRPLIPQWSSITAYAPSNTLVIAGHASNVKRLVDIVSRVDIADSDQVEVIRLRYASAKQLVKVLTSLQSANRATGKTSNISLAADTENNSILMSGNHATRLRMRALISELDTQGARAGANTVVIHLKYLDAKKLAPILAKIAHSAYTVVETGNDNDDDSDSNHYNANPTKTGTTSTTQTTPAPGSDKEVAIQADEDANAIIISAPSNTMRSLRSVVRQLDTRPSQVLIEAVIAQVDESLLQKLGITWGTKSTTGGDTSNALTDALTGLQIGVGVIKNGDIRILISALTNNSSSDILSTPSIMVLDNQKASIVVGQNVGLVNRQYSTDTTDPNNQGVPFNTITRKDVALTLTVTPHITPNKVVRLKLEQKNDTLANPTETDDNPIINTSRLKTTVMVQNGNILVLGGLISHDLEGKVNKIPILGDIPLIGHLFKSTNKTLQKKNLMVFLRPVVLTRRSVSRQLTDDRYGFMRNLQLLRRRGKDLITNINQTPLLRPLNKPAQLPPPF